MQGREVRARQVKGDGKELLDAHKIPLRGPCHMPENLLFCTNGSPTLSIFLPRRKFKPATRTAEWHFDCLLLGGLALLSVKHMYN